MRTILLLLTFNCLLACNDDTCAPIPCPFPSAFNQDTCKCERHSYQIEDGSTEDAATEDAATEDAATEAR